MAEKKRSITGRIKTTATGGVVVALLLLGAYLGNLFNGVGSGGDASDDKNNKPSLITTDSPTDQTTNMPAKPKEDETPKATSTENLGTAIPEVVEVVIDERSFFLKTKDDNRTPIELPLLIERVKKARGNADGLKIRIFKTGSARTTTELALKVALEDAKIPELAIYEVQEFLEK